MFRFAAVFTALSVLFCACLPAAAAPSPQAERSIFLQSARGAWSGKGQIVAGRYKGVKFSCNFTAPNSETLTDMQLNGSCRAGIFSQPIKASISRRGNTFRGSFNEGAKGNGLDIISGTAEKTGISLDLNREKLKGKMTARLIGENRMTITLAVKIDDEIIPVIDMSLTRADPAAIIASAKSGGSLFARFGN